jgi:hypothetical protein
MYDIKTVIASFLRKLQQNFAQLLFLVYRRQKQVAVCQRLNTLHGLIGLDGISY